MMLPKYKHASRNVVPFVQFQKRKKNHEGVLLLVQLQATKSNTPSWVFLRVLNCTNDYQIAQSITFSTGQ